jgi:hypothetical protein
MGLGCQLNFISMVSVFSIAMACSSIEVVVDELLQLFQAYENIALIIQKNNYSGNGKATAASKALIHGPSVHWSRGSGVAEVV